jgi:EAL domain-containing protein (putative c-di-GMP-specific phosphodiesterase class I)
MVKSIIDYAHHTGKKVVLEGVEKKSDLLFAKQLSVDYVQGYWYRDSFIQKMDC